MSCQFQFCHYEGTTLPYCDNAFDVITIFMALHHIPDTEDFLREVFRVLRPNGLVVIREHDCSPESIRLFLDVQHGMYARVLNEVVESPDFCTTFQTFFRSKAEWVEKMKGAGLEEVTYKSYYANHQTQFHRLTNSTSSSSSSSHDYRGGGGAGGAGTATFIRNLLNSYYGVFRKGTGESSNDWAWQRDVSKELSSSDRTGESRHYSSNHRDSWHTSSGTYRNQSQYQPLAMLLKYAEIVLALRTRRYDAAGRAHSGAMLYIKEGFGGKIGKGLAAAFAVLCLLCSFTLGGVIQSSAAAEAMAGVFHIPPIAVGVAVGGLAAWILARGSDKIESACTAIVPFVCVLFSVASVAVLMLRREAIPDAISAIFKGAFTWKSGGAGVLGFLTARSLRYGVARGLVSNEAGCGTAPIAHVAAETKSPAAQGVWGMIEVFVDTVLLCTMTALAILVSGVPLVGEGGTMLAIRAFSAVLGKVAAPTLSVSILIFAFATVLCWSHYGSECLLYLTGKQSATKWMIPAVLICSVVGAVAAPALLWELTDLIIALMAILNISALLVCRRKVVEETRRYFDG